MAKLPLAIDIADLVNRAAKSDEPLDVHATAERLLAEHPEATNLTPADVAEVVSEEYHDAADLTAQRRAVTEDAQAGSSSKSS